MVYGFGEGFMGGIPQHEAVQVVACILRMDYLYSTISYSYILGYSAMYNYMWGTTIMQMTNYAAPDLG